MPRLKSCVWGQTGSIWKFLRPIYFKHFLLLQTICPEFCSWKEKQSCFEIVNDWYQKVFVILFWLYRQNDKMHPKQIILQTLFFIVGQNCYRFMANKKTLKLNYNNILNLFIPIMTYFKVFYSIWMLLLRLKLNYLRNGSEIIK